MKTICFIGYPNKDDTARCINCGMELKRYWDKSGDTPRLVDERKY